MKDNIKELIKIQKKNNYSLTQMGALLGVHTATYVRWIKGKTKPQSQIIKEKIKEILKIG